MYVIVREKALEKGFSAVHEPWGGRASSKKKLPQAGHWPVRDLWLIFSRAFWIFTLFGSCLRVFSPEPA